MTVKDLLNKFKCGRHVIIFNGHTMHKNTEAAFHNLPVKYFAIEDNWLEIVIEHRG